MKKIIKYAVLISVYTLFIQPVTISAQKKQLKKVIISGISDSAVAVEIWAYGKFYVNDNIPVLKKNAALKNGIFYCEFEPASTAVYISLFFTYAHSPGIALKNFVVQPGDSLNLHEIGRKFIFAGRDSIKFQCQYAISKISRDRKAMQYATDLGNVSYYQHLDRYKELNDSANKEKLKLLEADKNYFGKKVYQQLKVDCMYDNNWFYDNMQMRMDAIVNDTVKQKDLFRNYEDNFKSSKAVDFVEPDFLSSKNYIQYLISKIKSDNLLASTGYHPFSDVDLDVRPVWKEIDTSFKGILREILLTTFFASIHKINRSSSVCIDSAIKRVENPTLKNVLIKIATQTVGSEAYNFKLPDISGKMHRLSDFRGKVVVVDYWYSGCLWCTFLARQLKTVAAEKDTNTVFITISIDTDKGQWKSSLAGEKYSSSDELNLYTNGLGKKHPLIEYYQINGYPTLFIIDKNGKISSVNPIKATTGLGLNPNLRKAIQSSMQ